MADFRRAKYSGSLNLAPECGPVLIELDTDAKTATASLEDPNSQYTLSGGGGLDYLVNLESVKEGDRFALDKPVPAEDIPLCVQLVLTYQGQSSPIQFIQGGIGVSGGYEFEDVDGVSYAINKENDGDNYYLDLSNSSYPEGMEFSIKIVEHI